jgi:hypothetical protein
MISENIRRELEPISLSPVTSDMREAEGKALLPEAREKILIELERYLSSVPLIIISDVAKALGVTRDTAKGLIKELQERWRNEDLDRIEHQIRFYERVLDTYYKDPKFLTEEKLKQLSIIERLMDKIAFLEKLRKGNINSVNDMQEYVIFHWGVLKPKTRKLLETFKNEPKS